MRVLLGTLAALLVAAAVTVSGQNQAQVRKWILMENYTGDIISHVLAQVQQALLLSMLQRNPALLQQLRSNSAVISQLQRTLLQQQKAAIPSQISRQSTISEPESRVQRNLILLRPLKKIIIYYQC